MQKRSDLRSDLFQLIQLIHTKGLTFGVDKFLYERLNIEHGIMSH